MRRTDERHKHQKDRQGDGYANRRIFCPYFSRGDRGLFIDFKIGLHHGFRAIEPRPYGQENRPFYLIGFSHRPGRSNKLRFTHHPALDTFIAVDTLL
jgi:hypothetical protein